MNTHVIKKAQITAILVGSLLLFGTVNSAKAVAIAPQACVDSDGGPDSFTAGTVVTQDQYDAAGSLVSIGEIVQDSCLIADPVLGIGKWNTATTGTHLQEASCTDAATGSITFTVIPCANGCNNGACNPVLQTHEPTPTPTVTLNYIVTDKKVEGKGKISSAGAESVMINAVVIRLTANTVIKLNYQFALAVDQKAEYKGFANSDGSVTATKIEVK